MKCEGRWVARAAVAMMMAAAPSTAQDSAALSNASIVAMVDAGLGADLVIAKIYQAPKVAFSLEVEDLVALKKAKVPEAVIKVMLERSAGAHRAVTPESTTSATSSENKPPPTALQEQLEYQREELGIDTVRVALQTDTGLQRIRIIRSEGSTAGMGFMAFRDYPGLKAKVRTRERRPTLLVRSVTALTGGRFFLVRLDVDADDGVRSLKVSSYKGRLKSMFGNSRGWMEPDEDWTAAWSAEEAGEDMWRVSPTADLEPGEYGWYADLGTGAQESGVFDFGVD